MKAPPAKVLLDMLTVRVEAPDLVKAVVAVVRAVALFWPAALVTKPARLVLTAAATVAEAAVEAILVALCAGQVAAISSLVRRRTLPTVPGAVR